MPVPVAQPPTTTMPLDKGGMFVSSWLQWFTAIWTSVRSPANTAAPGASNANGIPGQIAFDQNFVYVCVGTNTWKRSPLATF